jgi:Cu(I)/Ag(I) efflux system protein CusF
MKARAILLSLSLCATAQTAGGQASLIPGQVTKVDQSAGKITVKHGPIKKLGMDQGMTMVFKAEEPTMLKTVKAGDKINFDADEVNGQLTVIKIQKSK